MSSIHEISRPGSAFQNGDDGDGNIGQIPEARIRGTPHIDFNRPIDVSVLRGRFAVITGGASGIGLGIAVAMAEHGAHVAIMDRDCFRGRTAEIQINRNSLGDVRFFETDVTDWTRLKAAFARVLRWSEQRLDVVVVAAGLRSHDIGDYLLESGQPSFNKKTIGSEEDGPAQPPMESLMVNLVGAYYAAHLALFHFTKVHGQPSTTTFPPPSFRPQLLLIGSIAGYFEQTHCPDYCASKHGVRGLWKALRHDMQDFGRPQVNLLAPGFVDTPMLQGLTGTLEARGVRVASVDDAVAGALRCLCDENLEARAMCVVKRPPGSEPGSANFDLDDDLAEYSSGRKILEEYRHGAFCRVSGHIP